MSFVFAIMNPTKPTPRVVPGTCAVAIQRPMGGDRHDAEGAAGGFV